MPITKEEPKPDNFMKVWIDNEVRRREIEYWIGEQPIPKLKPGEVLNYVVGVKIPTIL